MKQMMRRFLKSQLLVCLYFGLMPVYSQSLNEYISIAEKNNPGLKAKYADFEAAMQKIPQVGALPDPSLTLSAFGQMVETRVGQQMMRISLSQMFPWFGTLEAQKNAAALSAKAKYEAYEDGRNELKFKVRATYYSLYEVDELAKLQKENLDILSSYKTLATSRFQNGKGKLTDVLRTELMINDLRTEITLLEQKRKPLVTEFNLLLNRPADTEINRIDSLQKLAQTFSLDSVLSNNPKLHELDQRIGSAQAQEQVAVKQGMPRFGLGFEYIVTAKRPGMEFKDNGKDAYMPMVTLSLPIYRSKYKGAVNESKHMQQSLSEFKTEFSNRLTTEFETSMYDRKRADQRLLLFENQIKQTEQIIKLLLSGYENSQSDFEEILMMQQSLLKYKMNMTSALKELHIAEAKLNYLTANN